MLRPKGRLVLVAPSVEAAALLDQVSGGDFFDQPTAWRTSTDDSGVLKINGAPTKHYSSTELEHFLGDHGFILKSPIEQVKYSWHSHGLTRPRNARSQPWDWLAYAERVD